MAEFPAMRLWTDSYLADTTHLTTIEHGAYLLLLMAAWRGKSHTLPNDDKLLAKYSRLHIRQWRRIRPTLEPFFQIEGGLWLNGRLLDEIASIRQQVAQRSDAGRRSALKRLNRDRTGVQRDFNENSTPIPIPTYKKTIDEKGSEEKSVKAYPGSKEFEAWKEYAFEKNMPLWRELIGRQEEGRGFEFKSPFPPEAKQS